MFQAPAIGYIDYGLRASTSREFTGSRSGTRSANSTLGERVTSRKGQCPVQPSSRRTPAEVRIQGIATCFGFHASQTALSIDGLTPLRWREVVFRDELSPRKLSLR